VTLKYNLVVLGPSADRYPDLLGSKLRKAFDDLGLSPDTYLDVVNATDSESFDEHTGNPFGVWFGGEDAPDQSHLEMVDRLRNVGAPILPLVAKKARFIDLVPDILQPINGLQWDDKQVTPDVLRGFRLTPDLRQAFISYKRADSSRVAEGIFDVLSRRKFRVFLDTASMESMEPVQDVLWDRLADMDLIILLDSPNALTSRWVNDELVLVNNLGLGVLQLVWPDHVPYKGTEFSTRLHFANHEFVAQNPGPKGRVKKAVLERIAEEAETVRISSLGARRTRVVGEFLTLIPPDLHAVAQPVGPVLLCSPASSQADTMPLGIALPIVGTPDAWSLHREELVLRDRLLVQGIDQEAVIGLVKEGRVRVVFDGLGVRKERTDHLIWLNEHLPLRALPIRRSLAAAKGHGELGQWLTSLTESAAKGRGST
jgi:hypothetical protein